MLQGAGVPHEVVTDLEALDDLEVGAFSRDGGTRSPEGPLIRVASEARARPQPAAALATIAFALAASAALALSRRVASPVKGLVAGGLWILAATVAYSTWWAALAPLDTGMLVVDWRTSGLVPLCVVPLLFAYDLYPLPGSLIGKTFWLVLALSATAFFSVVRFAFVAAGYAAAGPELFLAMFYVAGPFWDLAPGIAVLALAHALGTVPAASGRRRWWLP